MKGHTYSKKRKPFLSSNFKEGLGGWRASQKIMHIMLPYSLQSNIMVMPTTHGFKRTENNKRLQGKARRVLPRGDRLAKKMISLGF